MTLFRKIVNTSVAPEVMPILLTLYLDIYSGSQLIATITDEKVE
jgi:hypothetical protein